MAFSVTTDDDRRTLGEEKKWYRNVYMDHVCINSGDQTTYSVCSILELAMKKISCIYPAVYITIIVVQSNNDGQYANNIEHWFRTKLILGLKVDILMVVLYTVGKLRIRGVSTLKLFYNRALLCRFIEGTNKIGGIDMSHCKQFLKLDCF